MADPMRRSSWFHEVLTLGDSFLSAEMRGQAKEIDLVWKRGSSVDAVNVANFLV